MYDTPNRNTLNHRLKICKYVHKFPINLNFLLQFVPKIPFISLHLGYFLKHNSVKIFPSTTNLSCFPKMEKCGVPPSRKNCEVSKHF